MFIYVITNSATGKIYIGQHKGNNLKKYLQDKLSHSTHKRVGKSRLFASMRKHPKEVWSIAPLFEGVETKAELDRLETLLIALYDTRNKDIGYNICKGGEGFTGKHSDETRAKIASASREMWTNPEIKQIIVGKNTGRKLTGSALDNVRQASVRRKARGWKPTAENLQKLSQSHMGLKRSAESRAKQSQSVMGSKNHFFGKTHSEDFLTTRRKAIRCIETGDIFPSLVAAARWAGGATGNMSRAIRTAGLFMGRRFEYVNETVIPKEKTTTKKQVMCLDTGDMFASLTEAAIWLGSVEISGNLSRAIKSGGRCMGKRFEYISSTLNP